MTELTREQVAALLDAEPFDTFGAAEQIGALKREVAVMPSHLKRVGDVLVDMVEKVVKDKVETDQAIRASARQLLAAMDRLADADMKATLEPKTMTYGEWCPTCGASIVRVTRGIPSIGTCANGHKTDRRDVLRRPLTDPVAQELAAIRAELAQVKADADMAQVALVERAAADCLARSVDVANFPDDLYGDPRAYAAELLEDQHERILALAPDAGVKDLAALRAERDELAHVLDARETSYGLSSNGNMWRFWSDKAREIARNNTELRADRDRLAAKLAEAEAREKALREAAQMANAALESTEVNMNGDKVFRFGPGYLTVAWLRSLLAALAAAEETKG